MPPKTSHDESSITAVPSQDDGGALRTVGYVSLIHSLRCRLVESLAMMVLRPSLGGPRHLRVVDIGILRQ